MRPQILGLLDTESQFSPDHLVDLGRPKTHPCLRGTDTHPPESITSSPVKVRANFHGGKRGTYATLIFSWHFKWIQQWPWHGFTHRPDDAIASCRWWAAWKPRWGGMHWIRGATKNNPECDLETLITLELHQWPSTWTRRAHCSHPPAWTTWRFLSSARKSGVVGSFPMFVRSRSARRWRVRGFKASGLRRRTRRDLTAVRHGDGVSGARNMFRKLET